MILQVLWGKFVIWLWQDSDRTAAACARWHARVAQRIDAKMRGRK
jgi:hypothetical protein